MRNLIKICRSVGGCSRAIAEEIAQEARLKLFQYRRSAKVTDADYLLRRIAINLAINYYHRELPRALTSESVYRLDRRGMLIDPACDPERVLAAEQELDGVVSLLCAMSQRTCQIFIAQRAGYGYEEIAAAFAIKPRTVEKHIASAISALREA